MAGKLLVHVLRRAGLKPVQGRRGPRVHDLRHAFVVNRMLTWYREGINPQTRLPYLATYLGHKDINSTLVYLTTTLPRSFFNKPVSDSGFVELHSFALPQEAIHEAAFVPPLAAQLFPRVVSPKFHKVGKSILLISEGIAQNSLCGYWEHAD